VNFVHSHRNANAESVRAIKRRFCWCLWQRTKLVSDQKFSIAGLVSSGYKKSAAGRELRLT
jgi:hypothetical protein